jgi:hypothetical protein
MSNMSAPTVKHTPLSKTEKFWEKPTENSETNSDEIVDETVNGLLKTISKQLDTIINKLEKL